MIIRISIRNVLAASLASFSLLSTLVHAQPEPGAAPPLSNGSPMSQNEDKANGRKAVRQTKEPAVPGEEHIIERFELKNGSRVSDAVRLIAEASGLNVVATTEAGETNVTLFLKDVTARQAVEILAQVTGLWFRTDPETRTLRILTIDEYQDDLVVYRKDVTRIFQLQHPNAVSAALAVRNLYPGRVMMSITPINDDFILSAVGSQSLQGLRFGAGGLGGGGGFGGGGFGGGLGGGGLNQFNLNRQLQEDLADNPLTASQLRQLDALRLAAGDEPGRVSTGTLGELTSDEPPIFVSYVQQHNLLIVRTSDETAVEEIAKLIDEIDRPTPQVLLEMKILEVTLDDNFRSIFDFDYTDSGGTPNAGFGANATLTGANSIQNVLGVGNFPLEGGQLLYQFLDNNIRARIQFLAEDNRINVVGTPMIMASNNRIARIFVGEERVLTTDINVITNQNQTNTLQAFDPVTEVRDIGNTLIIQPKINADRTVTLTIIQESSTPIEDGATIPVSGTNGTDEVPVDTVNTATLQATVVAKDKLTTAVGGLIRTTVASRVQKVPWLGDLKYVGRAFRRETRQRLKTELVLLITPRILETGMEAEATTSERLAVLSNHPYVQEGDSSLEKYLYDPEWYHHEPWNPATPPFLMSNTLFEGAMRPALQESWSETVPNYVEPNTSPATEPAVPPVPASDQ